MKRIAVGAVLAAALTLAASSAHADSVADDLAVKLANYGVSANQIEPLIAKFQAGEAWDSLVPASVPTRVEVISTAAATTQLSRYADGSVRVTSIEAAANPRLRASMSNCRVVSGTGYAEYTGCLIKTDSVLYMTTFTADYSLYAGSNNDTIRAAYNASVYACYGTCGTPTVVINRRVESGSLPAVARLQMTYGPFTWFTTTYWTELRVINQTATLVDG